MKSLLRVQTSVVAVNNDATLMWLTYATAVASQADCRTRLAVTALWWFAHSDAHVNAVLCISEGTLFGDIGPIMTFCW